MQVTIVKFFKRKYLKCLISLQEKYILQVIPPINKNLNYVLGISMFIDFFN